jgi:hypothetical protein
MTNYVIPNSWGTRVMLCKNEDGALLDLSHNAGLQVSRGSGIRFHLEGWAF